MDYFYRFINVSSVHILFKCFKCQHLYQLISHAVFLFPHFSKVTIYSIILGSLVTGK